MEPMIKGFKDFLLRGNVVDLAVAVVIGVAFTAVVTSFTESFLRPLIGLVGGGVKAGGSFEVDGQTFAWGDFLNALLTFVLTAAVVYFVVVLPMKLILERRRHGEEAGPVAPTQVELLVEIRDLLRAQQGRGPGEDPTGPGTTVLPGQL
jgi:large conductance mechanosensitive channel